MNQLKEMLQELQVKSTASKHTAALLATSLVMEQRVPDAVRQQVLVSSPTTQLLTLAHWKLKHSSRHAQPTKPEDYKRCHSIASRIMIIKPLQ